MRPQSGEAPTPNKYRWPAALVSCACPLPPGRGGAPQGEGPVDKKGRGLSGTSRTPPRPLSARSRARSLALRKTLRRFINGTSAA